MTYASTFVNINLHLCTNAKAKQKYTHICLSYACKQVLYMYINMPAQTCVYRYEIYFDVKVEYGQVARWHSLLWVSLAGSHTFRIGKSRFTWFELPPSCQLDKKEEEEDSLCPQSQSRFLWKTFPAASHTPPQSAKRIVKRFVHFKLLNPKPQFLDMDMDMDRYRCELQLMQSRCTQECTPSERLRTNFNKLSTVVLQPTKVHGNYNKLGTAICDLKVHIGL